MISGHADVRIAVEAMSVGALTLLEKPFRLDELLAHLRWGMELDAASKLVPYPGRQLAKGRVDAL